MTLKDGVDGPIWTWMLAQTGLQAVFGSPHLQCVVEEEHTGYAYGHQQLHRYDAKHLQGTSTPNMQVPTQHTCALTCTHTACMYLSASRATIATAARCGCSRSDAASMHSQACHPPLNALPHTPAYCDMLHTSCYPCAPLLVLAGPHPARLSTLM